VESTFLGGVARLARFAERVAPEKKQTLRVSGAPPDTTEEGLLFGTFEGRD
jgi:hypothetical protein